MELQGHWDEGTHERAHPGQEGHRLEPRLVPVPVGSRRRRATRARRSAAVTATRARGRRPSRPAPTSSSTSSSEPVQKRLGQARRRPRRPPRAPRPASPTRSSSGVATCTRQVAVTSRRTSTSPTRPRSARRSTTPSRTSSPGKAPQQVVDAIAKSASPAIDRRVAGATTIGRGETRPVVTRRPVEPARQAARAGPASRAGARAVRRRSCCCPIAVAVYYSLLQLERPRPAHRLRRAGQLPRRAVDDPVFQRRDPAQPDHRRALARSSSSRSRSASRCCSTGGSAGAALAAAGRLRAVRAVGGDHRGHLAADPAARRPRRPRCFEGGRPRRRSSSCGWPT